MKPATMARCTIANELFRRRYHTACDNATSPSTSPEHQLGLVSIAFEETTADASATSKQERQRIKVFAHRSVKPANEAGADAVGHRTVSLDSTDIRAMHRRSSHVWKAQPELDHKSSAVFAAVRLRAQRVAQESSEARVPASVVPVDVDLGDAQGAEGATNTVVTIPGQQTLHRDEDTVVVNGFTPFPQVDDFADHIPSDHESSVCSTSPPSDTTLYEEPTLDSPSQHKSSQRTLTNIAHDDTEQHYGSGVRSSHLKASDILATPVTRRRVSHQRQLSTISVSDAIKTPSIPLRTRARTNDGLLQFKAGPFKNSAAVPSHRRKVSLHLPINTPSSELENIQRVSANNVVESHRCINVTRAVNTTATLTPIERDLEYKHRHTFVGTGSLDDFLELLEISPGHTTTKKSVSRAFVQLSSNEQLHARTCSKTPNGWELVPRTTLDMLDVTTVDYIVQLQVKLGCITLRQLLDMIPFDEKDEAAAMQVVQAFSAASHMDSKAASSTESKARAFRSWMIMQEDSGC